MPAEFAARYPGRCGVCDERIIENEICRMGEHGIEHADCDDVTAIRAPERPICDRCWLEQPCGCDDE